MKLADHVLGSMSIGPHQEENSTSPLCAGITKQNCNNFNNFGLAAILPLVKYILPIFRRTREKKTLNSFFHFSYMYFFLITKLTITFQVINNNTFAVYVLNGKLKIIPMMYNHLSLGNNIQTIPCTTSST